MKKKLLFLTYSISSVSVLMPTIFSVSCNKNISKEDFDKQINQIKNFIKEGSKSEYKNDANFVSFNIEIEWFEKTIDLILLNLPAYNFSSKHTYTIWYKNLNNSYITMFNWFNNLKNDPIIHKTLKKYKDYVEKKKNSTYSNNYWKLTYYALKEHAQKKK